MRNCNEKTNKTNQNKAEPNDAKAIFHLAQLIETENSWNLVVLVSYVQASWNISLSAFLGRNEAITITKNPSRRISNAEWLWHHYMGSSIETKAKRKLNGFFRCRKSILNELDIRAWTTFNVEKEKQLHNEEVFEAWSSTPCRLFLNRKGIITMSLN